MRNMKLRPPKYYDKLYDIDNPAGFLEIKAKRELKAKESIDNTPERLEVREAVQRSKYDRLIRKLY